MLLGPSLHVFLWCACSAADWWHHGGYSSPHDPLPLSQPRLGRIVPLTDLTLPRVHAVYLLPPPCLQLLLKDVSARLKLSEVADHPWIQANADPAVLHMDAAGSRPPASAAAAEEAQ